MIDPAVLGAEGRLVKCSKCDNTWVETQPEELRPEAPAPADALQDAPEPSDQLGDMPSEEDDYEDMLSAVAPEDE